MNTIAKALQAVKVLELATSSLAGAVLFFIMCVVCTDVTGRYLFNSPLAWSFDLISLYLMGVMFFFALSDTLRRGHHVTVDILYQRFRKRTQFFWATIGWALAAVFFVTILILVAGTAYSNWKTGDVVPGAIPWPTWIRSAVATLGLLLICARLMLGTIVFAVASFFADDQIALLACDPPAPSELER